MCIRDSHSAPRCLAAATAFCGRIARRTAGFGLRIGLLERPLALGNVQLFRGNAVVEGLLLQRILIGALAGFILIALLGQAVLPLLFLHLLVPCRIGTVGLVGAGARHDVVPGVQQAARQRADAGGATDGQLDRIPDDPQHGHDAVEGLLAAAGQMCIRDRSYDGGPWETVASLTAREARRSYDLPLVPRRHSTLRLRLRGKGQITLRSLAKNLAAAKGGLVEEQEEATWQV